MKTITVSASRDYDVIIGSGLLNQLGSFAAKQKPCKTAAIISDSNVWPLYGEAAEKSLNESGFSTVHYIVPAGECSKNGDTYLMILNFLAEKEITRQDVIISLGGGVVGDMAGFAAATYQRGISFVQVPTTLLAMVDSSVGGKTAINLPSGKNLAGAFYQPCLVVCDIDTLSTLPQNIFRDGCAEVIKYGVLYDEALFAHLSEKGPNFDLEAVISRCVQLKRNAVEADEFDTGLRQKLNFGHTIGHAIEAQSKFTIPHGQAVAIGMAVITKAAQDCGICHSGVYEKILSVLNLFHLPHATSFTAEALYRTALSDKKRSGESVNLILPEAIGRCILSPTPVEKLESFIKAGL